MIKEIIKEIFYGALIGFILLGTIELLRPEPQTCIVKEKESLITRGCDSWQMRVTCNIESDWDFRYHKSSL